MFDFFWAIYPVRKGKKNARRIWERENLDGMAQQIIDHVTMMLKTDKQWSVGFGIPHPSTYLNQERWEDEPEIEQPKAQGLPRSDAQLESWAISNGLSKAPSGMLYPAYRRKLESELERAITRRLQ